MSVWVLRLLIGDVSAGGLFSCCLPVWPAARWLTSLGNKVVTHYDQSPDGLQTRINANPLPTWTGATECHSAETYLGHVCKSFLTWLHSRSLGHGDKGRVAGEVDVHVCVSSRKTVGIIKVCFGCQEDGKLCFLSDRKMEGSVLSVTIIDGRVWLEGRDSCQQRSPSSECQLNACFNSICQSVSKNKSLQSKSSSYIWKSIF